MIDGVSSTPTSGTGHFTKNFVLEFARVRLTQVNNFLNHQLETMKNGAAETAACNEVLKWCAEHKDGVNSNEERERLCNTLRTEANKLPDGPLKQKMLDLANKKDSLINQGAENATATGDSRITSNEVAALEKQFKDHCAQVEGNCKEAQLIVNMKMGEQAEVTQLAAGLIQMLNESIKNVVGAMR